jgi:hypothetical protein
MFQQFFTLGLADLWLVPVLLVSAVVLLEIERRWTHATRRTGRAAPWLGYALDALAVGGGTLAVVLAGYGLFLVARTILDAIAAIAADQLANPTALVGFGTALAAMLMILAAARGWLRPVGRSLPQPAGQPSVESAMVPQPTRFMSVPPLPAVEQRGSRNRFANAITSSNDVQRNGHPTPAEQNADEPVADLVMFRQRSRPVYEAVPQTFLPPPAAEVQPATREPDEKRGWWHIPLLATAALLVFAATAVIGFFPHLVFGPTSSTTIAAIAPVAATTVRPAPATTGVPTAAPTTMPTAEQPVTDAPTVLRVNVDNLNMRSAAGTTAPVTIVLTRDAEVTLLGEESQVEASTWVRVRAGEAEGWVNRAFLR